MSRFRFKLDPVLKARRSVEQSKQRALAELHQQRIALEDVLKIHQQQIDRSRGSMREALVGPVNTLDLRSHAAATMRLMARAQGVALELAALHRRIDQSRLELLAAARDRRAIELLREKRLTEWKTAIDKAEQNALDELATMRAARHASLEGQA